MFRTIDGGESWRTQSLLGNLVEEVFSVFFLDTLKGWASGSNGAFFRTGDGGERWNSLWSSAGSDLRSVAFIDTSLGWLVGDGGTILRTTTGGGWPPSRFPVDTVFTVELLQNYPNPFMTSTTLSYKVMGSPFWVTLEVFNILGQRLFTLIDSEHAERVTPYTVQFNGGGLSSGVYFYRLTGEGLDEKKTRILKVGRMLLLK